MLPQFLQLRLTSDFSASKHNCFDNTLFISCCISHCHWVTTTAISWQLHTSLHNSPEYFPPPSTTESTSCSIVPSPTSKHSTFHISCCISHCHQLASTTALTTPSSFRVAIPTTISSLHVVHLANTTNSTFFSLFDFRKIHHPTDQLSPAGLTSVKFTTKPTPCLTTAQFTTPQINYPLPAWLP